MTEAETANEKRLDELREQISALLRLMPVDELIVVLGMILAVKMWKKR